MTREIVLLRQDIAPAHWHRAFDDLMADAKAGADGFGVEEQPTDKSGFWLHSWKRDDGTIKDLTPRGWASFYRGDGCKENVAFLHVQGW